MTFLFPVLVLAIGCFDGDKGSDDDDDDGGGGGWDLGSDTGTTGGGSGDGGSGDGGSGDGGSGDGGSEDGGADTGDGGSGDGGSGDGGSGDGGVGEDLSGSWRGLFRVDAYLLGEHDGSCQLVTNLETDPAGIGGIAWTPCRFSGSLAAYDHKVMLSTDLAAGGGLAGEVGLQLNSTSRTTSLAGTWSPTGIVGEFYLDLGDVELVGTVDLGPR